MPKALVLISDEELRLLIAEQLNDTNPDWFVEQSPDAASARRKLDGGKRYDLIVVHLEVSADEATPYREGQFGGLLFISWLTAQFNTVPVILINRRAGQEAHPLFGYVREREGLQLVVEGGSLAESLDRAVEKALLAAGQMPRPFVTLKINAGSKIDDWSWNIHGEGVVYDMGDKLVMQPEWIEELIRDSSKLHESMASDPAKLPGGVLPPWLDELRALGEKLNRYLLIENPNVQLHLSKALTLAKVGDSCANIKVCFEASEGADGIRIESICSEKAPHHFWMLTSPIYRDVGKQAQTRRPLFECRGRSVREPINCLLIEADTAGMADIGRGYPVPLPSLDWKDGNSPCDELHNYLKQNQNALGIGQILTISRRTLQEGMDFRSHLARVLRRGWQLIHYAGHSYYDPQQNTGFLFFPNRTGNGAPVAMAIEDFAAQLDGPRFVYLSCCTSGQAKNLVPLAKWEVPAVLGFFGQVFDSRAREFALKFYEQIVANPAHEHEGDSTCLQHAFAHTRHHFFDNCKVDNTWAQAVLMCRTRYT